MTTPTRKKKRVMPSLTLERRVKALELQVAQLQDEVRSAHGAKTKDWRRTIGAITDDEGMKEILREAMRLRELDRKKTRPKAAIVDRSKSGNKLPHSKKRR